MNKRLLTVLLALLICMGVFGVASAQADYWHQFMNHTYLGTGANYFDAEYYDVIDVEGASTGAAAACVGMSGTGRKVCGGEGEKVDTGYVGFGGTPYLHNHSTWNSYFNAFTHRGP